MFGPGPESSILGILLRAHVAQFLVQVQLPLTETGRRSHCCREEGPYPQPSPCHCGGLAWLDRSPRTEALAAGRQPRTESMWAVRQEARIPAPAQATTTSLALLLPRDPGTDNVNTQGDGESTENLGWPITELKVWSVPVKLAHMAGRPWHQEDPDEAPKRQTLWKPWLQPDAGHQGPSLRTSGCRDW